MTQPDIPEEQLARILPLVDGVRAQLAAMVFEMPLDAESAMVFDPADAR